MPGKKYLQLVGTVLKGRGRSGDQATWLPMRCEKSEREALALTWACERFRAYISAINPNPNTPRSSNTADPFFGLIPTKEGYDHFTVSCATPKHTDHNRQLSEVHLRSNTCKVYVSAAGELCAIDQRAKRGTWIAPIAM